MLFRGQHAHIAICHILLTMEALSLKIHFPGSLVFVHCSALEYCRVDFFYKSGYCQTNGKGVHYVGATIHLENDSNATEGIVFPAVEVHALTFCTFAAMQQPCAIQQNIILV